MQSTRALRSRAVGGKSMWRSDEIDAWLAALPTSPQGRRCRGGDLNAAPQASREQIALFATFDVLVRAGKVLRPLGTSRTPPGSGETRATRNGRSQRPVRQLRRRKEGDISYTVPEGSIVIFARAAFLLNLQEIVLAQLVMALSWESGAAERPHLAKSLCAAN